MSGPYANFSSFRSASMREKSAFTSVRNVVIARSRSSFVRRSIYNCTTALATISAKKKAGGEVPAGPQKQLGVS